jgi:hypothetical protein
MKSILLSLGLLGCTMSSAILSIQNLSKCKPSICPLEFTTEKIVNRDFSKTTCKDDVCYWNKSNYKNNLEGW